MIFKGLEKKEEGTFITRYDLTYETRDGQDKIYEIISRNHDMKDLSDLHDKKADAVVLIMEDETGEKLLLNKEYRMSVGEWVVNFPAGLIDPGETPEEAARRELSEETGLHIVKVTDFIGESYSAVGFANEKNVCVVGVAGGEFKESDSAFEEIESAWYTKEQVRDLLKKYRFAARTQAYCYLWSKA
ncbi:MAG: NUDIX hydrolase [Eubacterium sp.]|nr:NUDIX hydrolase [Eubacterium sp.]